MVTQAKLLFCSTSPDDAWVTSEYGIAVPPAQPLTPGHVVVAPRRHVAGFYDLDVEEQRGL
jgi:diadenosine tetraphosphate (Ap4A) HIT family hydrolase